jgi:hypothetical protein
MRFRNWMVVVFLGLGCGVLARAQAGVYVGYTATQLSGITCFEAAPITCSSTGGKVNPAGVLGGAYYDFHTFGPMRFGLDLRGGDFHSNKSATSSAGGKGATGFDFFLLGAKGSFRTHYSWLKPYVQVSAGYGRSNATEPFDLGLSTTVVPLPRAEDSFVMYEGIAGVSIRVFSIIDLRPVELGIGNMNRIGSGGPGDGRGSIGVKSIGASIVFHLPSQ